MEQKLLEYIISSRQNGVSDEQINKALISAGWNAVDINAAMQTHGAISAITPTSPIGEYKGLIINAVAVTILLLAGVVYWYWWRPVTVTPELISQPNNTSDQMATVQASIIDCGISDVIEFLDDNKVNATPETIKAWQCFSTNLQICQPTIFKAYFIPPIPGIDRKLEEFKIIGKQDDSCLVSGPKGPLGQGVPVTCAFSQRLIDWAYSQDERAHPELQFLRSYGMLGIIFEGGGLVPLVPVPEFGQENVICN